MPKREKRIERRDNFLGRVAANLGVTLDQLKQAFKSAATQALEAVRASTAPTIWDKAFDVFGEPPFPYVAVWNFYETAGYLRHLAQRSAARNAQRATHNAQRTTLAARSALAHAHTRTPRARASVPVHTGMEVLVCAC